MTTLNTPFTNEWMCVGIIATEVRSVRVMLRDREKVVTKVYENTLLVKLATLTEVFVTKDAALAVLLAREAAVAVAVALLIARALVRVKDVDVVYVLMSLTTLTNEYPVEVIVALTTAKFRLMTAAVGELYRSVLENAKLLENTSAEEDTKALTRENCRFRDPAVLTR